MIKKEKKLTWSEDGPKDMPNFVWTDDSVSITGKAFPEHAADSWTPFIIRLEEFFENISMSMPPRKKFTVEFKLDYYNSASNVYITKMMDILQKNWGKRDNVINWYYFKDDEEGTGEDAETYTESNLYKKVTINLMVRND